MNRRKNIRFELIFLSASLLIALFSCNRSRFRTTHSGLKYKIIRKGAGPSFVNGNYIYLNMDYYNGNDSLLFTYKMKDIPVAIRYIDSIWDINGQIYQGLKLLKVGDSAIFKVNCTNLYEKSFRIGIPPGLEPNSEITFYVGVAKMATPEEFRSWQANLIVKRQEKEDSLKKAQLLEDIAKIDHYLDMNNEEALESESGLRYIVRREGSGRKPLKGDRISFNYTGKLLDGTIFESSQEQGQPFEFIFGYGNVIEGLEEGVSLMSKGALYTFYIPSALAYGRKGLGNTIMPNSVLIFDVELLDIQKQQYDEN